MIGCSGRCICRICHPEAFPDGPRHNEFHAGARFGDLDNPAFRYGITVYLNDEDVTHQAYEACPGRDGFVCVMPVDANGRSHICPCTGWLAGIDGVDIHVCALTIRGRVTVTFREPAAMETEAR